MQPAFEIDSYQTELCCIVADVFRTMLNLDVELQGPGEPAAAGSVTATVHFAGQWKGAVLFQVSPELACRLSALLMSAPPRTQLDDAVRDAIGELANMIAGNLKSILPPGVGLSMPSVVEGSHYALRICGGNLVKSLRFSSEHGGFLVTLVEMLEE